MTVITMPSTEKKADNVPLVTNIEIDPLTQGKDIEAGFKGDNKEGNSKLLVLKVNNRATPLALFYMLMMSVFVAFMIFYGGCIYRFIGNSFREEDDAFYGTGTISLNDKLQLPLQEMNDYDINQFNNDDMESEFKKLENFALNMERLNSHQLMGADDVISEFKEDFELDLKDDSYEKIAPALPNANSARFIHDFSANVTGIVDVEGKRCFVMPLNRTSVLPPTSLYDLLFKMSSGYYSVDTKNMMHNMRVITPAIKDVSEYGSYVAKDCATYPVYKLEKIVSGVDDQIA
ncbi:uncharacterized protein LOC126844469 isoform X2 [Adelges cooleyi]|uniref:uncharacterized protein LOC126844469 isoform X2 n=1 Tax=Adelges cooleyi TaxID=133065 RepID=UPI00217F35A6|nr:uncharacterized protein LOC126844469 isoform X2 [Adelges cooleyi]